MPHGNPKQRIGRPPGSGAKGHVQIILQVRPDQRDALFDLAEERRQPRSRPPVSEVARELLDKALALVGFKRKAK